jgi:hypothetical protein
MIPERAAPTRCPAALSETGSETGMADARWISSIEARAQIAAITLDDVRAEEALIRDWATGTLKAHGFCYSRLETEEAINFNVAGAAHAVDVQLARLNGEFEPPSPRRKAAQRDLQNPTQSHERPTREREEAPPSFAQSLLRNARDSRDTSFVNWSTGRFSTWLAYERSSGTGQAWIIETFESIQFDRLGVESLARRLAEVHGEVAPAESSVSYRGAFSSADRELAIKAREMIESREAFSARDAARILAPNAPGRGTLMSIQKRLEREFKKQGL